MKKFKTEIIAGLIITLVLVILGFVLDSDPAPEGIQPYISDFLIMYPIVFVLLSLIYFTGMGVYMTFEFLIKLLRTRFVKTRK